MHMSHFQNMAGQSCGHEHHDHDKAHDELGVLYSLYSKVNLDQVVCLNEAENGSGKLVFKPWDKRLDRTKFVKSDADEELLFNIPFTGCVKLKGIIVVGGGEDTHPSKMRIFKNRPQMSFDDAAGHADQEFDMQPDYEGKLEYQTKVVKFSNVEHLSIHFPSNFGADETIIYYIGLKGDFTEAHRHGVTICTYEAKANPTDHTKAHESMNNTIN